MNLKPLSDHLIVKPIIEDKTTKSGIVLPDTVDKEKPETGEVVAVGPCQSRWVKKYYLKNIHRMSSKLTMKII